MQQSFDHSRVEHAHLPGSTSYNRQSTNTMTTAMNNGDDEGRVRFGRSGMCFERFDVIEGCGNQEPGVRKSNVQVIVERIERNADRNT